MKAILTTKIKRKKVIKYENLTRNKKIEWIAYLTPNGDYDQRKQSLFIQKYKNELETNSRRLNS